MISKPLKLKISHLSATWLPNTLQLTKPYHWIARFPGKPEGQGDIYLGSMILDGAGSRAYRRYHFKHLVEQLKLNVIVRTVEPFELATLLWGGVKAPSEQQYAERGVKVMDLPIGDFVNGFEAEHQAFGKQLAATLEALFQLQLNESSNVYFHCKAGKNRSFKTLTAYLCYIKFRDELRNGLFPEELIRAYIREVGRLVHSKRRQVIYHTARHRKEHEEFVLACLRCAVSFKPRFRR